MLLGFHCNFVARSGAKQIHIQLVKVHLDTPIQEGKHVLKHHLKGSNLPPCGGRVIYIYLEPFRVLFCQDIYRTPPPSIFDPKVAACNFFFFCPMKKIFGVLFVGGFQITMKKKNKNFFFDFGCEHPHKICVFRNFFKHQKFLQFQKIQKQCHLTGSNQQMRML